MNVYIADFNGVYLEGSVVVIEETKRKAFNKIKKEIEKHGLEDKNKDFTINCVYEFTDKDKGIVQFRNGDY